MLKTLFIFAILCCLSRAVPAQQLYANGASINVTPGGVLFVNGGIELAANTTLINNGNITSTKNTTSPSPGNFFINGAAVAGGNGNYNVEQDWINNGVFNAGNSSVLLFGNTLQNITSANNTVTTFNNLILSGTGTGNDRKKMLLNVNAATSATGTLTLNDRELATGDKGFSVMNPSPSAIVYNAVAPEGFVSSTGNGYLSRVTNTVSDYIFPTGSSAGVERFRALTLKPFNNTNSEFRARFNNYDANADNFDRNKTDKDVCKVNALFYHSLIRSFGTPAADVTLSYSPADDGQWEHIANWRSSNNEGWKSMEPAITGTSGMYNTITKTFWSFPDDHPYALSEMRPPPPQLVCPEFCENTEGNIFTAGGSANGYEWTVPSMATITSGAGTGTITVDWGKGSDVVSVIAIGSTPGCNSLPATCLPVVYPAPEINFEATTADSPYSRNYYFIDKTAYAAGWSWSFGDGATSSLSNPSHTYTSFGEMPVTLKVTTDKGCMAEKTVIIGIRKHGIFIPNAFSPNGDGLNDVFAPLNNIGAVIPFYIYNRWGELVYYSNSKGWDGRKGGIDCETGVYFYKVKYKDSNTGLMQQVSGDVTLIR